MVVEADPASALIVLEPNLLFHILVISFNSPPQVTEIHNGVGILFRIEI
jgi:hypothetical protein